ncbi:MAG: PPC domain-containing DNA-binding protein [Bdellovibrionia bacterium]
MKTHALRLKPGQDLYNELKNQGRDFSAGAILTCVGSLKTAFVRLAGGKDSEARSGPFEITSLVGTLSKDGVHLHIALADSKGAMWGGHLQPGSVIHTTAEIVIGEFEDLTFNREHDPLTGYNELRITNLR